MSKDKEPASVEMQYDHDMEKLYRERMGWQPKTVKDRYETPDPTPVAAPISMRKSPSIFDHVRDMIRREMSEAAEAAGYESFEDADDFDVDDDPFPHSRHTLDEDELSVAELRQRLQEAEAREAAVEDPPGVQGPTSPPPEDAD
jgi:hypothetical protein